MASKRDILETEAMLHRLGECLAQNAVGDATMQCRDDAEALRRISMTLHRWHELECNYDVQRGHLEYTPGGKRRGETPVFVEDEEKGTVYICNHDGPKPRYYPIADRERGALKRLDAIMKRYPSLSYYVQGDPRGCALYILRPGDVPAGERAGSYYSRGLAVHR